MVELPITGRHRIAEHVSASSGTASPAQPRFDAGTEVTVVRAWTAGQSAWALVVDDVGRYGVVSVGSLQRVPARLLCQVVDEMLDRRRRLVAITERSEGEQSELDQLALELAGLGDCDRRAVADAARRRSS